MSSILTRDQYRTTVVIPSETPNIILPLIVLIIFIVFLGGMLYLLISSRFQSSGPGDRVSSDNRTQTSIICPAGQCATNLQSGFKTCPVEDVPLAIDPTQSVCNSRFICDNPLTPYALQSDQSTDINGICEPNVECPCLSVAQCADYILSAFTTSNGNPYQALPGQRVTFPQESAYVSTNGAESDTPPIKITNPALTFCSASLAFLPLSNPGCNFVSAPDGNSMTLEELELCMGLPSGCSGLFGDPCLQGTLAILSSNPDTVNAQNITTAQYACVRGEPCPCGQIAIFDTNFGGIVCRQLR